MFLFLAGLALASDFAPPGGTLLELGPKLPSGPVLRTYPEVPLPPADPIAAVVQIEASGNPSYIAWLDERLPTVELVPVDDPPACDSSDTSWCWTAHLPRPGHLGACTWSATRRFVRLARDVPLPLVEAICVDHGVSIVGEAHLNRSFQYLHFRWPE